MRVTEKEPNPPPKHGNSSSPGAHQGCITFPRLIAYPPISLIDPSGAELDEVFYGGGGGGGGWCWDPACYGSGTLAGPGFWDPGFSQPINSPPSCIACGSNRYGVGGGSVTYDFSGYHPADPDQGIWTGYWDLLTITYSGFGDTIGSNGVGFGSGGGGNVGRTDKPGSIVYLKAESDCAGGAGRLINYELKTIGQNGTEVDLTGYTVTEHLVPRVPNQTPMNLLTGSATSQKPSTSGFSGFEDSIGGLNTQDNLQTFTATPASGGASIPVNFARDINGNDYGTNGIWVGGGQVFVNGSLAPKPCNPLN